MIHPSAAELFPMAATKLAEVAKQAKAMEDPDDMLDLFSE
jgi:hypothetical protein